MTFTPGSVAVVSLGGVTISAYLTGANFSTDRDNITLDLLGGAGKAKIPQSPDTSGTLEGGYTPEVSAVVQAYMEDPDPAPLAMVYIPQGTGDTYSADVHLSNWSTDTPGDDAATFSIDYEVNGIWTMA
jgi:hypothetical protein